MKYSYETTKIGQKNRIITRNNFPIDIHKIKLAPRSETKRNYINCINNKTSVKCLYPEPSSSKKYCKYSHKNDIYKITKLISSLDILKDLIYNQVNRFDF